MRPVASITARLYRLESAGAKAAFNVPRSAVICAGVHGAGDGVARTIGRCIERATGAGAKAPRTIDQIASAITPDRTMKTMLRLAVRERFDLLL
jgi:hypothetical protein